MITSSYDYSLGVLNTTFDSQVKVSDMLTYFTEVKRETEYPRKLKVLINANTAQIEFTLQELKQVSQANIELLGVYECIWIAFIVNSPTETAISFLYKELSELNNLRFSIFSTNEIATEWLNRGF